MKQTILWVILSTAACLSESLKVDDLKVSKSFILGHLKTYHMTPPVPLQLSRLPKENWLEQKLDHFDTSDNRTWKQKYYSNTQWYNAAKNGPIFILIGGEDYMRPAWAMGGLVLNIAIQQKAAVYCLEHRFYGDSRPTENLDIENLKYLSSEQAIADVAELIRHLRETAYPSGKLVVFGGSYAGNLAIWAKIRYPHLIDGAVASSAPLLAQVDFSEYLEVVAKLMNDSHPTCWSDMEAATGKISELLEDEDGSAIITQMFHLCTPFDATNKQDVAAFFAIFSHMFSEVAQTATSLDDVREFCTNFVELAEGETPLERLAYLTRDRKNDCYNATYASLVESLGNLDYDGNDSSGDRQWVYQSCTEFGFYQTSASHRQPFRNFIDIGFYLQWCKDIFSNDFDEEFVNNAIQETNVKFGGKNPDVNDVIFTHGSLDPWHVLGILQDLTARGQVIMIEGSSHCADFSSTSNSKELKDARKKIAKWVGKWVRSVHSRA